MIRTCKITKVTKHPDSNKLKVCQVDNGQKTVQVICGASNVQEGMITIIAEMGSTLPSGVNIQVGELRGMESHGMLCSPKDLNLSQENGIIHLPKDSELGIQYNEVESRLLSSTPWFLYKLVDQHIEENGKIKVTRNKVDTGKLISETYWDGEKYLYRSYL